MACQLYAANESFLPTNVLETDIPEVYASLHVTMQKALGERSALEAAKYFDLSHRAKNVLIINKINTVEDLASLTPRQIMCLAKAGNKTWTEFATMLHAMRFNTSAWLSVIYAVVPKSA